MYTKSFKHRMHERVEWFANQMRICVDGIVNLRCAIRKQFTYHLPQTKICRFFYVNIRTEGAKCPFHALGVLCSPQVRGKLINYVPNTHHT